MQNQKVANILNRIADLLEISGVDYRTKAYRRAAHTVEFLSKDIGEVKEEGKLQELPGIGKSIARKIEEIIDTGSLEYYENLKKEFPVDFEALLTVEGIGPKTVKLLYEELGVKDLDDLERQAKRHRIRRLKGMGDKSERRILQSIEFARKNTGRKLLGYILPVAENIKNELKKFEAANEVEIAGSIRRRKETVGDIDILVTSNKPGEVMDFFTTQDMVDEVIVKGSSKSTVRLKAGIECDLRVFFEGILWVRLGLFYWFQRNQC